MAAALMILVVLLVCVGIAHADSKKVTRALAAAESLFDEQEYAKVVKTLRPALSDTSTTRAQRLRALELTALSQLILGADANDILTLGYTVIYGPHGAHRY